MDASGMMRDLDQIRERDERGDSSRMVLVGLGGLAAACLLFAAGVLIGREGAATARPARTEDPLARLDALAGQVADAELPAVTYPDRLLDGRSAGAAAEDTAERPGARGASESAHPVALPAGVLVEPGGRVRGSAAAPAQLPIAAPNASVRLAPAPAGAPAAPGAEGAYTLQVSSFRTPAAAQAFAQRLRERGHRAFVATGPAAPGGTSWHRVRIGPFASQREANRYRADFELRERLPTFVVRRDEPGHGG